MSFDWKRLRRDKPYRAELIDWIGEDDELREEGRLIAKTNLLALCWILGYDRVDPVMHAELLAFFIPRDLTKPVNEQGQGQALPLRGTALFPRGAYKTTVDECDTVQELICFPLDGITFFLCANQNLAWALVANVGAHFIQRRGAAPTLFQALFPELVVHDAKAADGGSFSTAQRQTSPPIKEHALMGWSVEAGVSGWHCHRLKCDDIANNRNMKSETSQAEVFRNYRINRAMLNPGGIEDRLGTRYGPNDPYGLEISNSRPGSYRYVSKPALRLKSGERLEPNGFPERDEVELLFEGLGLTYDDLRDKYESGYEAFMCNYMNDPYGANEVPFPLELMSKAMEPLRNAPMDGPLTIFWRVPNKTAGWRSSAALVAVTGGLRMYLIDGAFGHFNTSGLAVRIVTLAQKHDVDTVTIEDSPGARHIEPHVANYAAALGYSLHIFWAEHKADQSERDGAIKAMEPLLTSRRLLVSEDLSISKQFFEQFTHYGMSDENALPHIAARLTENLPRFTAQPLEEMENANLALQMALERDRFNQISGGGRYAHREPDPVAASAPEVQKYEEPRNPWGLDSIMPGLNG